MLSMAAVFASILAASWSKLSFALSLLRIPFGRVRVIVRIIIVTTNLVFGALGLMQWIQCWPVARSWDSKTPGKCWPSYIFQKYSAFASGQCRPP